LASLELAANAASEGAEGLDLAHRPQQSLATAELPQAAVGGGAASLQGSQASWSPKTAYLDRILKYVLMASVPKLLGLNSFVVVAEFDIRRVKVRHCTRYVQENTRSLQQFRQCASCRVRYFLPILSPLTAVKWRGELRFWCVLPFLIQVLLSV